MAGLIVLTCASGKQCTQLIPLIYQQNPNSNLRLVVNSQKSLERLHQQWPKVEVMRAALDQPNDCARAVSNATTLFYVGPLHPHEAELGMNIITATTAESKRPGSTFSHFIFSSVLHPTISKLLHHDRKRLIEERLIESMIPYAILRPSHFADNAIDYILSQKDEPHAVFDPAHDPEIAFSFTCLRDYAEVAARAIREGEMHFYATYEIVSTRPTKYIDYVQSIASVIGKTLEIRPVRLEQAVPVYCRLVYGREMEQVDQASKDTIERMLLYYNSRGLLGNPNVLEWLLGRPGTAPAELAKMTLDEV